MSREDVVVVKEKCVLSPEGFEQRFWGNSDEL